ncbi:hypothetical protein K438DRAFT_1945314 [Mycena galopus ATCC 62051]|nr:hypothetical protein K438DRAFT_1945314 [Mycena galopus ATCC 62051]
MSPIRPTAPRTRAAQPYKPIGTLVDQLNRIIEENATPRFDVNATMAYDKAAVALGFTLEELEAMAAAANPGIIGVSCIKCDLPVALWGFGLYIFDTDDNTLIDIDYICKACWKYSLSNSFRLGRRHRNSSAVHLPCWLDGLSRRPNRLRTSYSSCHDAVATRAQAHSSPQTRTEVRDDIDALIKRRQQAWDELWERHDQAVGAGESFNANKHDLSGIKRRLDEAVDLRQQLRNTRVANFRMPPRSPKILNQSTHWPNATPNFELVSQAELSTLEDVRIRRLSESDLSKSVHFISNVAIFLKWHRSNQFQVDNGRISHRMRNQEM